MARKFDPEKKGVLVAPERYEKLDPLRVLSFLPMLPYQHIADVGCGPGFFTVPLGKYVFDGRVYALDIQQEMLDAAKKAVDDIHLTNVEFKLTKEDKIPLEDASLDGVFIAFVVHEAESAAGMLEEAERALRKGGWLAILEWYKREMETGPPLEDRIDESDMGEMAQKAGFHLQVKHNLNDNQYMLVMRK